MTRARKVDPAILEREYIFDSGQPPISITALADKYGMARSGIADKARIGRWYDKRKEFRERLGEKAIDALGDHWVAFETSVRQKLMTTALAYLDKYTEALNNNEIKVNTRDMLGVAAMVRVLLGDVAAKPQGEEGLIDPGTVTLDPAAYRDAIAHIKQLRSANDEDDAGRFAATGTEGSGED